MLQLLYISSSRPGAQPVDLDALLVQAQANNSRDAVTGLLFTDGRRFLQVLEGAEAMVEAAFTRIKADPRHSAVVLLARRTIDRREFGSWSMARRAFGDTHDGFLAKIAGLCRNADPAIAGTFAGLIDARRVA